MFHNRAIAGLLTVLVINALSLNSCRPNKQILPDNQAGIVPSTISLQDVQNASYSGFLQVPGIITMKQGRWEGEPYVQGAATRPSVSLIDTFLLNTDLDHDEIQEGIVFLTENSGGSGSNIYLAILKKSAGRIKNSATRWLGDRVQIKQVYTEDREIVLEIVTAGAEDAACCPGDVIRQRWRYHGERLIPSSIEERPRRLNLSLLEGTEWTLINWRSNEAAVLKAEITLAYRDSMFAGSAGCNRYFMPVREGKIPGSFKTGKIGATRMMCPEEIMSAEDRFLNILESCDNYGFLMKNLRFSYTLDGNPGILLFRQKQP